MKTLETKRLLLRAWQETDADDMYAYAKNPLVGPSAGWKPHENREESLRIIAMFSKENVWAVVHKKDGKVIGSLGLDRDMRRSNARVHSLGYVLSPDYWGQGLMVEAASAAIAHGFNTMELDLISVVHYPFNAQSRRVIEKLGFRYEGTLRQATTLFTGQVHDDVCYSMTKEEWMNMTKYSQ